jgi:glutamate--cysteine ligase
MPAPAQEARPLRDLAELRRHFESGGKPAARHRLGVEHEKILVAPDGSAPGYDTIRALLERILAGGHGWAPVAEDGNVIALRRLEASGAATVTLEPGGQFELSDAPRSSAREAEQAVRAHLAELAGPLDDLHLRALGIGFRPFGTLDEVPWMPKGRYRVMREYLPRKGALAHEMMKRTATVQVNIDYADPADCAAKVRAAMGVSSLVTALWAASPLVDGQATAWQSRRASCWLATDDDRCGLLPFVFADGVEERFYDHYTAWALDVPMFFVYRAGRYLPVDNLPFRRFLVEGWNGERATQADWELHLSTLFPEVRLKQYIEIRGADAGPLEMVFALPSLVRGLLYDAEARAATWALVADWSFDERQALRREVPREGLRARVRGQMIVERCRELVRIAAEGLRRLGAHDDVPLLAGVERVAHSERSVADEIRELHAATGGDRARLIESLALPPA